jgi:hypothetical protein
VRGAAQRQCDSALAAGHNASARVLRNALAAMRGHHTAQGSGERAGARAEVVVFNPLGWQRVSVVEVVLPPALRVAHGRPSPGRVCH